MSAQKNAAIATRVPPSMYADVEPPSSRLTTRIASGKAGKNTMFC